VVGGDLHRAYRRADGSKVGRDTVGAPSGAAMSPVKYQPLVCLANTCVSADDCAVKKPVNVNVTLDELIVEGLKIQPRFVAEPLFAKTGKGFMRTAGVEEIAAAKQQEKRPPVRQRNGK